VIGAYPVPPKRDRRGSETQDKRNFLCSHPARHCVPGKPPGIGRGELHPGGRKPPGFCREDECANFWPGCRPARALVRCHGLCPWGSTLPGRRIKRPEIGELFRVGDRSVSQERRRLRDRLSDDRNAQNLFKGFLGKCNDWRIDPLILFTTYKNPESHLPSHPGFRVIPGLESRFLHPSPYFQRNNRPTFCDLPLYPSAGLL